MEAPALSDLVAGALTHCRVSLEGHGGLITSLALAGLAGGFSHCAGMCGPLALIQVSARLERIPLRRMREWHRWAGALLLPYHLGRATTYAVLGAAAALASEQVSRLPGLKLLSAALLALAALVLLAQGLRGLKQWLPALPLPRLPLLSPPLPVLSWTARWGRRLQPLWRAPVGGRGYLLGVALGFLPCGLIYGAVAAAAASGDAVAGAIGMLAFSAGTVPGLLLVSLAGHGVGRLGPTTLQRVATLLLLANAALLGGLALFQLWH